MTKGSVTKLVNTFGSTWGRIRPEHGSREIFFNIASLEEAADFSTLEVGQAVEFDECADYVNGIHAEHLAFSTSSVPRSAHLAVAEMPRE
jgi:cold shock CspA family protein